MTIIRLFLIKNSPDVDRAVDNCDVILKLAVAQHHFDAPVQGLFCGSFAFI